MDLGAGDAAAVYFFDLERGVEVQGGGGVVEDLRVDSGVDEGSEEHVATDAGEAVEVGDAHEGIVSWDRFFGVVIVFAFRWVPPPWGTFGPKVFERWGLGLDLVFGSHAKSLGFRRGSFLFECYS